MNLNLARKWRSKTFDQIIGQELSVRMLKNSLYLDRYFPVYLFNGQRGCGKTTTARVFAAAVNCFALSAFQKDPKNNGIPCLVCESCLAIAQARHPDFIEIDAASHTGVDNVRNIIEAASLMPILGKKKIYLIDEAHMLSKAACNAFLKILEEPPASVFFILATTDLQKIPDTVTSRCFQLLFTAINVPVMLKHLEVVCKQESIGYEQEGLIAIIKQSKGSARDALNLLEQVRFSAEKITYEAVQNIVGCFDDQELEKLLFILLKGTAQELIGWLDKVDITRYPAHILWETLLEKIHFYARRYYTNRTTQKGEYSLDALSSLLETFYSYELLFIKTGSQHRLLETLFLNVCRNRTHQKNISPAAPVIQVPVVPVPQTIATEKYFEISKEAKNPWQEFVSQVEALGDPLVTSVFKQGTFEHFKKESGAVDIIFSKELSFFKELLESSSETWKSLLKKHFSPEAFLNPLFIHDTKMVVNKEPVVKSLNNEEKRSTFQPQPVTAKKYAAQFVVKNESKNKAIDITDTQKWKQANMLVKIFPGNITEIVEDEHE